MKPLRGAIRGGRGPETRIPLCLFDYAQDWHHTGYIHSWSARLALLIFIFSLGKPCTPIDAGILQGKPCTPNSYFLEVIRQIQRAVIGVSMELSGQFLPAKSIKQLMETGIGILL